MHLSPLKLSNSELAAMGIESSDGYSVFVTQKVNSNPFAIEYEQAMVECFRGVYSTTRTPGATRVTEWQKKSLKRVGIKVLPGVYVGGLIHLRLRDQVAVDLVKFKLYIESQAEKLSFEDHLYLKDLTAQINIANDFLMEGIASGSTSDMQTALDERDHILCQVASLVLTEEFVAQIVDPMAFNDVFGRTIGKYVLGYIQEHPSAYHDPEYAVHISQLTLEELVHEFYESSNVPAIQLESIQEFTNRRYC